MPVVNWPIGISISQISFRYKFFPSKNSVKIWGGRINCIGLAYPIKCLQCLIFDTEEKIFSSNKDGIISHEGIQNIK